MVISHPTNTQICHLSRPEFYFQFCDRGSGERNTFFSFSKIGAFDLKAETVVMKRKATKPGAAGEGKARYPHSRGSASLVRIVSWVSTWRWDPKAQEKRISSGSASRLRKQAGR